MASVIASCAFLNVMLEPPDCFCRDRNYPWRFTSDEIISQVGRLKEVSGTQCRVAALNQNQKVFFCLSLHAKTCKISAMQNHNFLFNA